MINIDYYKFTSFTPYELSGEVYKTLKEAKSAYMEHLRCGHRLGGCIYGCTAKDDSISLTYTPFYSDTKTFGKTRYTNIGHAIDSGSYTLG